MLNSSDAPRWPAVALFTFLVFAGGCSDSGPRVQEVDVPEDVFTIQGEVIAYEMRGEAGTTYEQGISLAPLRQKFDRLEQVTVSEYSPDSIMAIPHERRGDTIVAQLRGGNTYLITALPVGQLRAAYKVICWTDRYKGLIGIGPDDLAGGLCPLILCPAFRVEALYEQFPPFGEARDRIDLGSGELPGLGGQPGICEKCDQLQHPARKLPTCKVTVPPPPPCANLLYADFGADAVGGPPSTSPAGPPPGDALAYAPFSSVTVIASLPMGSNAVKIERGSSSAGTFFDAITFFNAIPDPGSGPHVAGKYEVGYRAYSGIQGPNTPVISIGVRSPTGARAFGLGMLNGNYVLATGAGNQNLPINYSVGIPDEVTATIDLDAGTVSLRINNSIVASGQPFIDSSFAELGELRVEHPRNVPINFAAELVIDDIRICTL